MNYKSRTGFGHVKWPWWHDALICGIALLLIRWWLG